jgi:N-hydroxyarylamine O-acetyltransferase
MLSARVYDGARPGPEFDHMVLLVDPGERMLADVGFGDSFLEPLRLDTPHEVVQHGSAYRLSRSGADRVLERRRGSDWEPQYVFSLVPRQLAEFTAMCEYQQSSRESHFTQKTVCSLATSEGRITLSNSRIIVTAGGRRVERDIATEDEYRKVLATYFGVDLGKEPHIRRLMIPVERED